MAVGDIYQAKVFYNIGSEITMNVVHYKETVASTDDIPAETIALALEQLWGIVYTRPLFSAEASVILFQVRRVKPTTGIPTTLVLGSVAHPAIPGEGISNPVPSQAAALVSLYTAVMTANARGRIYIPGVSSGVQNDGQLIEAAIDDLEEVADGLEEELVAIAPGTGAWALSVYSRVLGTAQPVVQTIGHSNMATQRGRRNFPGVGA